MESWGPASNCKFGLGEEMECVPVLTSLKQRRKRKNQRLVSYRL